MSYMEEAQELLSMHQLYDIMNRMDVDLKDSLELKWKAEQEEAWKHIAFPPPGYARQLAEYLEAHETKYGVPFDIWTAPVKSFL